jgi:hypothetical protein
MNDKQLEFEARLMGTVLKIKDIHEMDLEYDDAWAKRMQETVEDIMGVLDWVAEDGEEFVGYEVTTPSGYLYCGCPTCVLREVLFTATALVVQGVKDGKVRLADG